MMMIVSCAVLICINAAVETPHDDGELLLSPDCRATWSVGAPAHRAWCSATDLVGDAE